MGFQERVREQAEPFLEQDETIHGAFLALTYLPVRAGSTADRLILVTDRAVVILRWAPGFGKGKPTEILSRLSLDSTNIGPVKGLLITKTVLGETPYWIPRVSYRGARAASAALEKLRAT